MNNNMRINFFNTEEKCKAAIAQERWGNEYRVMYRNMYYQLYMVKKSA